MVRVGVELASTTLGTLEAKEVLATRLAGALPHISSIYIIQPVHKLPVVNVTRTVAGFLAGRKLSHHADYWIIRVATKYQALWHMLGFVYVFATVLPFVIGDVSLRSLASALNVALVMPILIVHGASLCWDLLLLLVGTFEFWFLVVVNLANNVVLDCLFQDIRVLSSVFGGAACLLPMFLDANLYLHTVVLRLFVAGAPCLLFIIMTINFHFTPDANYSSIRLWEVELQAVDLLVNGGFIITFFMTTRVFRYRRQIFALSSSAKTITFQCDNYFPVCRLMLYEEWSRRQRSAITKAHNPIAIAIKSPQLELIEHDQLRIIDARDTIARLRGCDLLLLRSTCAIRVSMILLNIAGFGGCAGMVLLCGYQTWTSPPEQYLPLHMAALVSSAIFCSIHAAYYQRDLARRICIEIDAWFVSFQAIGVTLGVCDAFSWDKRCILALTALLWCHWMIFLDAIPPVTRHRLSLPRGFIVAVTIVLLLYPVWISYIFFFSKARDGLRNRVVFHATVEKAEIQLEMQSFLATRIFTLWVWMGRFFWREVLRPVDSFKLIKFRVHLPLDHKNRILQKVPGSGL